MTFILSSIGTGPFGSSGFLGNHMADDAMVYRIVINLLSEESGDDANAARTANQAALAGTCRLKSKKLCASSPQHPRAAPRRIQPAPSLAFQRLCGS
jgi:hypothetical protein